MPVTLLCEEDKLTAVLSGEIDHHHAREIRQVTDAAILRQQPHEFCFDFEKVSFMDSSGIGLIMGRYRLCEPYGGKISIVNASSYLRRVMHLAGIDSLVSFQKPTKGTNKIEDKPKKEEE